MSTQHIRGVITALVTPYDEDGEVNVKAIEQLVNFQLDAGINGFFLCGSTGEGLLLSEGERRLVAETVVDVVKSRAKVIVHVGALSTRVAVNLASHAAKIGADAIAAIPPIYFKVDQQAIKEHYRIIARASALPLFAYHIPGATGVTITVDMIKDLLEIPTLQGIKFSDSNLFEMANVIDVSENRLTVLYGIDQALLAALIMGAHGGIGLNYNILPRLFVKIYRSFTSGNVLQAQQAQHRVIEITRFLKKFDTMRTCKPILRWSGIDCGQLRRPLRPLTQEEERRLKIGLDKLGFFK